MGKETACRVCMKKSKDTVDLEAILNKKPRITYREAYNLCTHLNALLHDGLPTSVCEDCKHELKAAYNFVEKAKESDRKLREKLGFTYIPEHSVDTPIELNQDLESRFQAESVIHGIKTEYTNCLKDPLEDSDIEIAEKSEDEIDMDWAMQDDCTEDEVPFAASPDDDYDDDDNKPLKELIEEARLAQENSEDNLKREVPKEMGVLVEPLEAFNEIAEPECSSDDGLEFKRRPPPRVHNVPPTCQAQIFPQGPYVCKICQKAYFTGPGLKAHIAVHLPKKKKVKRGRPTGKKKGRKKKNRKVSDDEEAEKHNYNTRDEEESQVKKADEMDEPKDDKPEILTEGTKISTVQGDNPEEKKRRRGKAPKPKKLFPCQICGKHLISASKLRYHMVIHTGEKDYLCTMCPKAYSTIYALKHHMRTHTGERPYECEYCGDKFTRPTTLKSHMRRHTGERPYGCEVCGKRFIQHSSMTTHMKLNHMAKTISCPQCDRKYARQTDLNTHLLSHTGDKPFSCKLCPSRFIRQANLNKHMNRHHGRKNNNQTTPERDDIDLTSQELKDQPPFLPKVLSVRSINQTLSISTAAEESSVAASTSGSKIDNIQSNTIPHPTAMRAQSHQPSLQQHGFPQATRMEYQQTLKPESRATVSINIPETPYPEALRPAPPGAISNQIGAQSRLESVAPLKATQAPIDNLTNLLGQAMDSERMGRTVDDIIRWNWSNTS